MNSMKVASVLVGVAVLLLGATVAAFGAEHRATRPLDDPIADTAVGNVRILTYGRTPWTVPAELHRGATYEMYARTFEAVEIPETVERVDFGVHLSLAPDGQVPYPFSEENLPASESYSGAHLQGSPWVPPYGPEVVVVEETHTFTRKGEAWNAELELDTDRLPADATRFRWVLGSWYVAHLRDGTRQDVIGLGGASEDPVLVVTDGDPGGRALQQAGLPGGAMVAAAGTALALWGAFARRA